MNENELLGLRGILASILVAAEIYTLTIRYSPIYIPFYLSDWGALMATLSMVFLFFSHYKKYTAYATVVSALF